MKAKSETERKHSIRFMVFTKLQRLHYYVTPKKRERGGEKEKVIGEPDLVSLAPLNVISHAR